MLSYRSRPHCGGQGVYVRQLSAALHRLGHHVEVFSGPPYPCLEPGVGFTAVPSLDLYRDGDPFRTPSRAEFRDRTDLTEFLTMRLGGFGEPRSFAARVVRMLARRVADFDVVLDNQGLGPALTRLPGLGLPLVVMIHHPISVDRRVELAAAPSWTRRLAVRRWYGFVRTQARTARRLPAVLTVSESSAGDIVRDFGVPPQRITVVPVGVDPAVFTAAAAEARVPGRLLAVVSADIPLKGLDVLLDALVRLRRDRPHAHLLLAGGAPAASTRARLRQLPAGAVTVTGAMPQPELARAYAGAEVVVVPSRYEGFSLPALEAMACGTPVVASRAGALPEVLGEVGVLVPPGDPAALADALGALLADPARRDRLARAGRARVTGRFTWDAVAARTAEQLARAC